jgi:ribosomal protein L40E
LSRMRDARVFSVAIVRKLSDLSDAQARKLGVLICATCGGPRSKFSAKSCRACYQRRAASNKQIREIYRQLAFIRREMKLRWFYEGKQQVE